MCTTAELVATRSANVDGSNADALCHLTAPAHLGVWPAGDVYAFPVELGGGQRRLATGEHGTHLMLETSQPLPTAALQMAEPGC